ncbi:hypothetical protein TrCOL_g1638 [Triparma columacea]|uniref:COMM domain-containing protein n=1 Tax=Triparma columacea TaxID=722753 RepID=A0A9W7LD39_9STRA|nr:hypothetical protein TrCOL_g1638 [Triparma columacea]
MEEDREDVWQKQLASDLKLYSPLPSSLAALVPPAASSLMASLKADDSSNGSIISKTGWKLCSFESSLGVNLSSSAPSPSSSLVTVTLTKSRAGERKSTSFETTLDKFMILRGELERVLRGMALA